MIGWVWDFDDYIFVYRLCFLLFWIVGVNGSIYYCELVNSKFDSNKGLLIIWVFIESENNINNRWYKFIFK